MERKSIAPGVNLCTHKTEQFKTSVVSVNIIAPLDKDATSRALLIHLLARTNKDYPEISLMNRRLASLYGASLSAGVRKTGEAQILSLTLVSIDDRFSLDGDSVLKDGITLLLDCLFKPDITPEGFRTDNVEREKRLLAEKIEGERDDKRIYALTRMLSEMCSDEAYGIDRLGKAEDIPAITEKSLLECWKKLIFGCQMQINVTGSFNEDEITSLITDRFLPLSRRTEDIAEVRTEFVYESYGSKTVTEKQNIKQGKLVIGMRAGMTFEEDNFPAIKLMTAIFGSGTFSKLFMNVREKMSLCYYCSARLIDSKGIITVESGVETENTLKALEAIRNELDAVRKGDFDDETLNNAKLSLIDSYNSFSDSVINTDLWATLQCNRAYFRTPAEYAELIKNVSREEVIVAANMVTEDTVFILESEKEAE